MRRVVTFALVLLFVAGLGARAGVPPMINYQGKLMQPSGAAVPDGTYSMTFAIYDVPTGGTALWSETNPSVQVKGGLFAVLLGSVTNLPANIFDNPDRWFGVKVAADPEMTPRQKVASVAYAQVSGNGNPPGTIVAYAGASAPDGYLLCNGQAISRNTYAALFAAISIAFGSGDGATTFNLPDFRGVFPKGSGTTDRSLGKDASGNYYSGVLGTYSQDQMQGHKHASKWTNASPVAGGGPYVTEGGTQSTAVQAIGSPVADGTNGTPRAGLTTEPQSLAVTYMIKT